ncbi:uncharacterized protein LOC114522424 [Dendronephthya gigantea]|uniref:uncharacterized protein LOC114522424 n=1 Tax=Dendronephthya gigantea TaxID=151771 RepID=UPI001069D2CE|nr:uncharacterized protein LOC114522424 [Dendronephthya gigantea]
MKTVAVSLLSLSMLLSLVDGHGYLKDPPSRASRWRYGFSGPREYTDNQLSCGGRNVQWSKHGGKCGACGDEYGISNPRFVSPGVFAKNPPIVKTYTEGELIEVTVKITAHHKGYFIFRVAPLVNPPITQADLDKNMLALENGNQEWTLPDSGAGDYTITLRLPTGLSCDHCVMQWWYTTGNNWGGNEPETFVNCADIKILPSSSPPGPGTPAPNPVTTSSTGTCPPCNCPKPVVCPTVTPCSSQPEIPAPPATTPPATAPPTSNPPQGSQCYSINPTASDAWCSANCAGGYCPATHCVCT